jgi:putative ATP-binding cassette transporter
MRDLLRLLGYLLKISREIPGSRRAIALFTAAGIAGGLASTAMIALVNSVVGGGQVPSAMVIAAFAGLCVALPCFRFLSQMLLINLSQRSLVELRLRISRELLRAPLRQLESLGAARLMALLANDIGIIVDTLATVPILLMHASLVISCFVYLGWLDWRLLLEVSGVTACGVACYLLAVRRALGHFVNSRRLLDDVVGQIRSLVEGTKELKMSFRRRDAFLRLVDSSTRALQGEIRAGQKIFAAGSSWGQVLFFVVIGFVVIVLPHFQPLSTKALTGYTIVLFQLMAPLEVLLNSFPGLSRSAASVRVVESLGLALQPEAGSSELPPAPVATDWGALELTGVCHSYFREGDESFLLGPIDLAFRPGELVFIVGGNGSGKTTLAKLLIGLYAPEAGEVRFAGQVVTEDRRDWYREHFSAVFSDFFLFDRLLGFEAAFDQEIRRYLALLRLDQQVRTEGGVLSTIELSQGQRKRLALLAAYLEDRPIYLFDEWAADQDPQFKEIFYRELLPSLQQRGKTVFVISHDDRYFGIADRIVKLDYGRVETDVATAASAASETMDAAAMEPSLPMP